MNCQNVESQETLSLCSLVKQPHPEDSKPCASWGWQKDLPRSHGSVPSTQSSLITVIAHMCQLLMGEIVLIALGAQKMQVMEDQDGRF